MKKASDLSLKEIEEIEYKYLIKYWHFLKFAESDIIDGFNSMYDIQDDWKGKYGNGGDGTTEFSVGAERIVYAILNGKIAGRPNSSPVSSDLFFEVDDAYIHIDLKTVLTSDNINNTNDNIGDFNTSIFVGENQNSYNEIIQKRTGDSEEYKPNLPCFYTKKDGTEKICLSYFVTILSNSRTNKTELVNIMCMPNGKLSTHYRSRPLKAGKNPGKARFNFINCSEFELLDTKHKRVKIVYANPNMSEYVKDKLKFQLDNFIPEIND